MVRTTWPEMPKIRRLPLCDRINQWRFKTTPVAQVAHCEVVTASGSQMSTTAVSSDLSSLGEQLQRNFFLVSQLLADAKVVTRSRL